MTSSLTVAAGATAPQPGEQAAPFCVSVQVTPLLGKSSCKWAEKSCVELVGTLAEVGDTVMEIDGTAAIVIVPDADFEVSATDVAVMVTAVLAGATVGAAKVVAVPLGVVVGATVPQAGEQVDPACVRVHVTPLAAGSLPTVAVISAIWPTATGEGMLPSETVMGGKGATVPVPPQPTNEKMDAKHRNEGTKRNARFINSSDRPRGLSK